MPGKSQGSTFSARLEARKRDSTLQLLFKCARLLNEAALGRVRTRSGLDVRPSHTALFPHIDLAGTRLTELARRLGVSKQAASQLVEELEEMGIVRRSPDPSDGRAKLVHFSARGKRGLLAGLEVLRTLEAELAAAVGAHRMGELHDTLARLLDTIERPPAPSSG